MRMHSFRSIRWLIYLIVPFLLFGAFLTVVHLRHPFVFVADGRTPPAKMMAYLTLAGPHWLERAVENYPTIFNNVVYAQSCATNNPRCNGKEGYSDKNIDCSHWWSPDGACVAFKCKVTGAKFYCD